MFSLDDCLETSFSFEKHLHLNDISFEDAFDVLKRDCQTKEDCRNLIWQDYSHFFEVSDQEYLSLHELIERNTKLPVFAFGEIKRHRYSIQSTWIDDAFQFVNKAVKSLANSTLTKLSGMITAQAFDIPDTEYIFYTGNEDLPTKKMRVDTLGLYEFGKMRIFNERESFDFDSSSNFSLSDNYQFNIGTSYIQFKDGPQIILDARKIEKSCKSKDCKYLMAVVALHELMHAFLDPHNHDKEDKMPHSRLYRQQKEEAWANALMLKSISDSGQKELMTFALDFVKCQPKEGGYQYGLKLFNDICNNSKTDGNNELWNDWIDEKANWDGSNFSLEREFSNLVKEYTVQ